MKNHTLFTDDNLEMFQAMSEHFESCAPHFLEPGKDFLHLSLTEGQFEIGWDESWNYGGYERGDTYIDFEEFIAYAKAQWDLKAFDKKLGENS